MSWYIVFLFLVFLLWVCAAPKDRIALRIILIATIGSFLLTEGITRHIMGAWKLLFPGLVETLTILALLRWTPNRTGYLQSLCLLVAWCAHLLCYIDVVTGSNMVYDNYVRIIEAVAFAQLVACYETISHILRWLGHRLGSPPARSLGGVRHTGVSANLLHNPRPPGV